MEISKQSTKAFNVVFKSKRTFKLNSNLFLVQEVPVSKSWKRKIVSSFKYSSGLKRKTDLILSLRPVRHGPRQASQLSGTYLPDDFGCDAWRRPRLTGRGDTAAEDGLQGIYLLVNIYLQLRGEFSQLA
jgi:hypothetical protein